MKKLFFLLFVSFTLSSYCQSKQILDFNAGYAPENVYKQLIQSFSETEINYIGSDTFLETIKSQGIQNPTIQKAGMEMETVSETGKMDKEGNFPITITYIKSETNEGKTIIPNGTMLYGKVSLSTMPKLDSISAKGLDETLKNSIFEIVKSTFSQVSIPIKKIKVGDSFSQDTPLTIPMAGIKFEMLITTTYKLKNIIDQNANFDINQVYKMKITESEYNIEASGNGTGTLTYDIPNHFITENTTDIDLHLKLKKDDFTLKVNSKSKYGITAKVSKK